MVLSALAIQVVPFAAFGQSARFDKTTMETDPPYYGSPDTDPHSFPKDDDVVKTKIAPDLEEKASDLRSGRRDDEMQKVIIQLKSETRLNEMFGNDLSEAEQKALFAREVRANRDTAGILVTDLASTGGHLNQSFNRVGLASAELPLSKIQELAENENVAFISPDRQTHATGHVETTTGTAQIRPLLSTTVNGEGIGIAILDSGIEANHADFKPLITSRVTHNRSFLTGNTSTVDKFGHGTHVSSLAAGADIFSNNASGYYNGVAAKSNILNLPRFGRQWPRNVEQCDRRDRLDDRKQNHL